MALLRQFETLALKLLSTMPRTGCRVPVVVHRLATSTSAVKLLSTLPRKFCEVPVPIHRFATTLSLPSLPRRDRATVARCGSAALLMASVAGGVGSEQMGAGGRRAASCETSADGDLDAWLAGSDGKKARALFEELAAVEEPSAAWLLQNSSKASDFPLWVIWSHKNYRTNRTLCYATSMTITEEGHATSHASGLCWDFAGAVAVVPSRDGEKMLVVRDGTNGRKSCILQVWGEQRLLCEVEVIAKVLAEGYFSSFDWDEQGRRVCFVAEPSAPEGPAMGKESGAGAWKGEARFEDDWGEALGGLRSPRVYTLDVEDQSVTMLQAPCDHSCGHCVWSPGGEEVVYTAWPTDAEELGGLRRPGMIYCFNRRSALYRQCATASAMPVRLSQPSVISAANPSFSPDGKTLAFLSNRCAVEAGTHDATQELLAMTWQGCHIPQSAARTVVPAVLRPSSAMAFPGLYTDGSIRWVSDRLIAVQTQWRSESAVAMIDVDSASVRRLTPAGSSYSLLAANNGRVVAARSTPTSLPEVVVGRPAAFGLDTGCWEWKPVAGPQPRSASAQQALSTVTHQTLTYTPAGAVDPIEAIVLSPIEKMANAKPLLFLHGGPHTTFPAAWAWAPCALASQGWTVIMPNYRGSKGFGEAALQSLPGNIGSQDVGDSLEALKVAYSRGLCGDPATVGVSIVGGSHGGFLGCHFAGQFPKLVRAAVVRNPVCDISSMVASSDIPDWCCKEALGDAKKFTLSPSLEDLAAMRACSPAAYVQGAAAVPHLFLIGAADRRVPPSQGLLHGKLLKEKGAKVVTTYVFPEDAHPLSRPRTNLQQWLLTFGFLMQHHGNGLLVQRGSLLNK
mmetsp:Transcript_113151/g.320237  ORF Transcript_113151/g.320237 Transcript_113151/m.320237 type:complete len:847 (-) Transcript_113151:168-2708(-)